jgi:hypothetical protein
VKTRVEISFVYEPTRIVCATMASSGRCSTQARQGELKSKEKTFVGRAQDTREHPWPRSIREGRQCQRNPAISAALDGNQTTPLHTQRALFKRSGNLCALLPHETLQKLVYNEYDAHKRTFSVEKIVFLYQTYVVLSYNYLIKQDRRKKRLNKFLFSCPIDRYAVRSKIKPVEEHKDQAVVEHILSGMKCGARTWTHCFASFGHLF